jgi:hypothetical protein
MSAKLRTPVIVLLLVAMAGLILLIARPSLDPWGNHPTRLIAAAWVVFFPAAWLVRRTAVRVAVGLILIGGIAFQVAALAGPPQNSSDMYRYMWDGRVQVAGIDPYLYPPGAAGVAGLRNSFLWSAPGSTHKSSCVTSKADPADPADAVVAGCTMINRAKDPTIYPPVAEAYFAAVQLAAPADDSTTPMQAAAAGFAVLVTVMLLLGLRSLGRDPRLAVLWAWCPTVPLEAGQNAHVDVVAVALTLGALLLLARPPTDRRLLMGGALLGLAIATKLTPVLVVPAVLRRGWVLMSMAAATAITVVYAPHVFAVGSKILGFLPGYLNQNGYDSGTGFRVIALFVHGKATTLIAVVILGAIALAVLRWCDPAQPWRGGVLMTSAALAVTTPHYQWYAILLVMLVALDGQAEWLIIAAGGYLANSPALHIHGAVLHNAPLLGYGGGAAVACVLAVARLLITRLRRTPAEVPVAEPAALSTESTAAVTAVGTGGSIVEVPAGSAAETTAGSTAGSDAESIMAEDPDTYGVPPWEEAPEPVLEPTAIYAGQLATDPVERFLPPGYQS